MTTSVGIFAVDRGGKCFDSADEQLAVLFSRTLEVADEVFDLVSHQVERVAEITEFGATRDCDAFREVAGRDAMRAARELAYRVREFVSKENPSQDREQSGDEADPEHLPAH